MEAHSFNKYFINAYCVSDDQIPTLCPAAFQLLGQQGGDSEQSNKRTVLRVLSATGRQDREEEEQAALGIRTDPARQHELRHILL